MAAGFPSQKPIMRKRFPFMASPCIANSLYVLIFPYLINRALQTRSWINAFNNNTLWSLSTHKMLVEMCNAYEELIKRRS